ncbi:Plasmodium vivax Vir protein, putative [Plasmodium vivax]|nr:Plasmodium vivax Vir protein, putative [Plasmodium vivax]
MPEIKVDAEELKKHYPFLDKIWTFYDEFNEEIGNLDEHKGDYVSMCEKIMQNVHDNQEWYKDLCIKLIRNLGTFSSDYNKSKYNLERCKNLNSWLYYIIKDYNVDDDVITNIFNQSNTIMASGVNKPYCSNYLYKDKYNDPDKIIKLINLVDYMKDFLSILTNNHDKNHCLCRKFIYECANIYREMNKIYCAGITRNSPTISDTCSKLQEFSTFFTSYISTEKGLEEKLPSLTSKNNEYLVRCFWTEQDYTSTLSENNSDGPILLSVPSVLGSFAGISSLLMLSYKFTPIFKWLRSGQRGTAIRNILSEEEASVLLSHIPNHSYIYTHNEKYGIGYTPLKN